MSYRVYVTTQTFSVKKFKKVKHYDSDVPKWDIISPRLNSVFCLLLSSGDKKFKIATSG